DGSHCASGREAGNEHPGGIDAMVRHHRHHHLSDRRRLSVASFYVLALKPVETAVGIVQSLLLWQQQGETESLGQRRPSRAKIIARRALRTAVQHDDERAAVLKTQRDETEHPQRARITSELWSFSQMIRRRKRTKRRPRDQPGFHERLPLIRPSEETAQVFSHVAHRSRLTVPSALAPLSEIGKKWCSAIYLLTAAPAIFFVGEAGTYCNATRPPAEWSGVGRVSLRRDLAQAAPLLRLPPVCRSEGRALVSSKMFSHSMSSTPSTSSSSRLTRSCSRRMILWRSLRGIVRM